MMGSAPDHRGGGRHIGLRFLVATLLGVIIGSAMWVVAAFGLSYPTQTSAEIGVLGGMGAAIYILYFL